MDAAWDYVQIIQTGPTPLGANIFHDLVLAARWTITDVIFGRDALDPKVDVALEHQRPDLMHAHAAQQAPRTQEQVLEPHARSGCDRTLSQIPALWYARRLNRGTRHTGGTGTPDTHAAYLYYRSTIPLSYC